MAGGPFVWENYVSPINSFSEAIYQHASCLAWDSEKQKNWMGNKKVYPKSVGDLHEGMVDERPSSGSLQHIV